MKRSHSFSRSPTPSSPESTPPPSTPSPKKKKLTTTTPKKNKPTTPEHTSSSGGDDIKPDIKPHLKEEKERKPKASSTPRKTGPGPWTPEKKELLAETLITAGLASYKSDQLAQILGVTKQQLSDATQKGKNNVRARIISSARSA